MNLIDSDNLVKTRLTPEQMTEAERLIDSGEVTDPLWEGVILASDFIDKYGDMCVDEIMYDDLKDHLKL